jgi:hypothetical protein
VHLSGSLSSSVVDVLRCGLRRLLNDPEAVVLGARREPAQPWMPRVAPVANEQTETARWS